MDRATRDTLVRMTAPPPSDRAATFADRSVAPVAYDTPYGEPIMVHVQASYTPMVPTMGILPSTLTINAYHVMRSEAN